MTFPLAGDLPDPWIDGENPNAAAMKLRVTDKLNLLAGALGAKTARVSCSAVIAAVATVNNNAVTQLPVTSIGSSTGGTWSISAGSLVVPATGIYIALAKLQWSAAIATTYRNFFDLGLPTVPITPANLRGRTSLLINEDFGVVLGIFTVTGASDNKIAVEALQTSGAAKATLASTLDVVQISA